MKFLFENVSRVSLTCTNIPSRRTYGAERTPQLRATLPLSTPSLSTRFLPVAPLPLAPRETSNSAPNPRIQSSAPGTGWNGFAILSGELGIGGAVGIRRKSGG